MVYFKSRKFQAYIGITILAAVVLVSYQNCSGVNLRALSSGSPEACVEPLKISSIRETNEVRFLAVANPGETPVTEDFQWTVTFGTTTIATGVGEQITVANTELRSCARYRVAINRDLTCDPSSVVSTFYIHGENCNPIVDPPDEEKPDPEDPIEYGPNSCPLSPIPQDDGCDYKDANGNDEVPENHDGMTVATHRQMTGQAGSVALHPTVSFANYSDAFSVIDGNRPQHCANCGPASEGYYFPTVNTNNIRFWLQPKKFIALKFKVPTGQNWHHIGNFINQYPHGNIVAHSFARCPGQFRDAPRAPLPEACRTTSDTTSGKRWEIIPRGGSVRGPHHCGLVAGQTYYLNIMEANLLPNQIITEGSWCEQQCAGQSSCTCMSAGLLFNSMGFIYLNPDGGGVNSAVGSGGFDCRNPPPPVPCFGRYTNRGTVYNCAGANCSGYSLYDSAGQFVRCQ